jgi:hypothetical protein
MHESGEALMAAIHAVEHGAIIVLNRSATPIGAMRRRRNQWLDNRPLLVSSFLETAHEQRLTTVSCCNQNYL